MKSFLPTRFMPGRIFLLFIFLQTILTHAQDLHKSNPDRQAMLQQEAKRLEQLIKANSAITANQQQYDAKYYCLDLTPNPLMSTLSGIAEIRVESIRSEPDESMELRSFAIEIP